MKKQYFIVKIIILLIISILLCFASIVIGEINISVKDIFSNSLNSNQSIIFFEYRIPKMLTAVLVGSSLALSGILLQSLFKNPLVGPNILGISSGAELVIALSIMFSVSSNLANISKENLIFASFIGATIILIVLVTIYIRIKNTLTVLLIGLMLNYLLNSIITMLEYTSNSDDLKQYITWTMGNISNLSYYEIKIFAITTFIGFALAFLSSKMVNTLILDSDLSKTIGVNILLSNIVVLIVSSILIGSATVFCGNIAFVGIISPHIARMFFRTTNTRILIIATILIGVIIVVFSDIISQILFNDISLPINTIISIISIPIIIIIIMKNIKISF